MNRLLCGAAVIALASGLMAGCGSSSSSDDNNNPAVDLGDFVYATDAAETIDLVFGVDYGTNAPADGVINWGSGAAIDDAHAADADYSPCIQVDNAASTWGGQGALAFTGFTADFTSTYTALNFKFKAETDKAVNVKFPLAGAMEEIVYNVAAATDLGNGWYEFSIPLSNHGDLSASTEFAFLATGDFYVTDVYFSDGAVTAPAAGDIDGDARYYVKSGDGNRQVDIIYSTTYQEISIWSSGTVIADGTDATYGAIWTLTPGNWWGRDAGAIAFTQFTPGYFSSFTTMKFKYNPGGVYTAINVKFPGAATAEELSYDLATYGTDLGDGWYEVAVPIAGHGDVAATTEFAILTDGTTDFSVTDVYFE